MRTFITGLFFIVGLINFVPVAGVFGADVLADLYGIPVSDPTLLVLLQHRAVLFGIVGGFILASCLREDMRFLASVAGYVSMGSYMLLYLLEAGTSAQLASVFKVDVVAIVLLAVANILHLRAGKSGTQVHPPSS